MPLNILNIIELGSKRIGNVNDNDFPIGFAFIKESHDAENFDLFDLTHITDLFADLANIKWVIVTFSLGLNMRLCRIFPCLIQINNP